MIERILNFKEYRVPDPNVVNFSRYVNLENIFYAYVTHIVY